MSIKHLVEDGTWSLNVNAIKCQGIDGASVSLSSQPLYYGYLNANQATLGGFSQSYLFGAAAWTDVIQQGITRSGSNFTLPSEAGLYQVVAVIELQNLATATGATPEGTYYSIDVASSSTFSLIDQGNTYNDSNLASATFSHTFVKNVYLSSAPTNPVTVTVTSNNYSGTNNSVTLGGSASGLQTSLMILKLF